jgi:Sideroflexins
MSDRINFGNFGPTFCTIASLQLMAKTDEPRYSQETYFGRFRHMLTITSPVTLLKTQKDLDEAMALLSAYKKGDAANVPVERLWKAKQLRFGFCLSHNCCSCLTF